MAVYDDFLDVVPGPDRPIDERVQYVERRTISELEAYADDVGLASVRDMPQNTFTAALRHCCKMIFKPAIGGKADYFKIDRGDVQLILALSELYIDICDRYNRVCQVQGLSAYLGVSDSVLYDMAKYDNSRYSSYNNHKDSNIGLLNDNSIKDSSLYDCNNNIYNNSDICGESGENLNILCKPADVIKGIKAAKERQLQGLLIDGKGNLIGVMSILNHEFGYRSEGVEAPAPALTSSERQKALADKYRVSALPDKLSDN